VGGGGAAGSDGKPAATAAAAGRQWYDAAAVARLCEMGFEAAAANEALVRAAGDEAAALDSLLSG